jgi:hypothetical protein
MKTEPKESAVKNAVRFAMVGAMGTLAIIGCSFGAPPNHAEQRESEPERQLRALGYETTDAGISNALSSSRSRDKLAAIRFIGEKRIRKFDQDLEKLLGDRRPLFVSRRRRFWLKPGIPVASRC